ncbi:YcnI family protein [Microbacterium aerolatum]|uniref:YcnI family copper-binding membrane protein n=1 Tax=Microbacterium aerolatum TaxID=153731 RepID=UPI00200186E9|nr:YcnI family protein [Microbacterium aerolatum]MCK3768424.1 YcnI family protein [Microbacterium aerolatum]
MLKPRRGVLVAALAAGLVLAAPAAAQAHVGVSPDSITPEGSAVLAFSFTHGCENSPTTALRITMPDGLTSVSPTIDAAWDVAVERADNGLVSAVSYTAATPIPHDLRGEVTMAVRLGEDAPETLAFPVEQQCETGVNEWIEIAEDGEDPHDLESPAPVVTVGEAADAAGETQGTHAGESEAAASAADPAPAIGIALGSAGLLAGVVALVIAIRASRRSAR